LGLTATLKKSGDIEMAEQETIKTINGVDTQALEELIESVQEDPSLAKSTLRVRNKWIKADHSQTTVCDFYGAGQENSHEQTFVMDAGEPLLIAGKDEAASPMEYLLHSLAGCLTSTLVYQAALRGIEIQEIESHLEGDLDVRGFMGISDKVRKGYSNIRASFKVKTDEENLEELKELTKFSAVFDAISNATPIDIQVEKK
jgi:uncharacterized OsmC-like protein